MSTSFANKKELRFVFTLAIGSFFTGSDDRGFISSSVNTLTLERLRASVNIDLAGGAVLGRMSANIYGMTASDMNAVTTTQWDPSFLKNTVEIHAIDGTQDTVIFQGNIINAWGVYAGMPEVYLMVEAYNNYIGQITSPNPNRTTIASSTDIATVMGQIAGGLKLNLINNGVVGTVRAGQTLSGSFVDQAKYMAQTYNFSLFFSPTSPTLFMTPNNVPGQMQTAPLVSAQTGLINYPRFNGYGVQFDTLFNPAIVPGATVVVQSAIPKANGPWMVVQMSHQLESQSPGGQWKSTVNCVYTAAALAKLSAAERQAYAAVVSQP